MLTLVFTLNPAEKHSQFLQIKKILLEEASLQLLSMIKRWQPYMDCPWKQKCIIQLNFAEGRIKITLPFLTFFENSVNVLGATIEKMLIKEKISTCSLTSAISTQEKNTRFIIVRDSKKNNYGYPESSCPELKVDDKLITQKYTSLSADDMVTKYFPWQELPSELLVKIAIYLCHSNFTMTCRLFFSITQTPDFWQNLLQQHFLEFIQSEFKGKNSDFFAKIYQLLFTLQALHEIPLDNPITKERSDRRAKIILEQLTILTTANPKLKESPWIHYVLGFCNAHGLGKPQEVETAIDHFKQAAEAEPSLSKAKIMRALTYPAAVSFSLSTEAEQIYLTLLRNAAKTQDPIALFYLGRYLLNKNPNPENEGIKYLEQSLELGLNDGNYFLLPNEPRRTQAIAHIFTVKYITQYGTAAHFDFFVRAQVYSIILLNWSLFIKNGGTSMTQKALLEIWLNKTRREQNSILAKAAATDLLSFFSHRIQSSPSIPDGLSTIEIKQWSQECQNILKKKFSNLEQGKFRFIQTSEIKLKPPKLVTKDEIEMSLKKIIQRQNTAGKPITWEIITINDQSCAKMNWPVKPENHEKFKKILNNFKISFVKNSDKIYPQLIIHNIDPSTFIKSTNLKSAGA